MGSQTEVMVANYPNLSSSMEAKRLQSQHHLVVNAFGSMVLCPADLTRPNFRALDSCGADGFWLSELRHHLTHPDSATLISTDLNAYPTLDLPDNIQLKQHNMMDPYPEEWAGTFDLVHQRAAVVFFPSWAKALEATRRQIALLKPGAWIQLVDSIVPTGAAATTTDTPTAKFFKTLGNALAAMNLNTHIGTQLDMLLREAGDLEDVGTRTVTLRLGKGAGSRELEELGMEELDKMVRLVTAAAGNVPGFAFSRDEVSGLLEGVREEARTDGVDMTWYAAWGRKKL